MPRTFAVWRLAAGLCAAALQGAPAQAARPLQTDDAGVLAQGDCEVEAAWARQRQAPGEGGRETSVQLGCGVGWQSQVDFGLARLRGASHESGAALGGKTGLWQAQATGEDGGGALALGWGLSAAKAQGGAWRHAGSSLTLIGSLPVTGPLTLHANLGHERDEIENQRATTWGLALEHAGLGADARWVPVAEVYGDDRSRARWNLGLRHNVEVEKFVLDLAFGRPFGRHRPSLLTLGLTASF